MSTSALRLGLKLDEQPLVVGDRIEVLPEQSGERPRLHGEWPAGVLTRVNEKGIAVRYPSGRVELFSWTERELAWRRAPS